MMIRILILTNAITMSDYQGDNNNTNITTNDDGDNEMFPFL